MNSPDDAPVDAGPFSPWLAGVLAALDPEGGGEVDVPCDGCTACCSAAQFIHIGPDEVDVLAHIPSALLVPAPQRPRGHVVLGYDELGRCPMLVDGACSIYEHRPRACRTYDCRVFPAAGVEPDEPAKLDVRRRARRWRFAHPTAGDEREHDAVRTAARAIAAAEPGVPATALAVLAIRRYREHLE